MDDKKLRAEVNRALESLRGTEGTREELEEVVQDAVRAALERVGAKADTPMHVEVDDDTGNVTVVLGHFPSSRSN